MKDDKIKKDPDEGRKKSEEEIDQELEQTFPASDPPSYSSPGNDKAEEKQEDARSGKENAQRGKDQ